MKSEKTLEQKVQELLKVDKEIKNIEHYRGLEIEAVHETLLGDFTFDDELEFQNPEEFGFISQEEYLKEKCGEDPLKKIRNTYNYPQQKPQVPILAILGGVFCLIGIILAIISWSKNFEVPFFQGFLAIAGFIVFKVSVGGFKAKKAEYNRKMDLYVKEKASNDKLKVKHNEWNKKVENAKKEYQIENENREKRKKDYFIAYEAFASEALKINEKYDNLDEYATLCASRDKMQIELLEVVKEFDDRIPESKKFDLDLFIEGSSKDYGRERISFINDLLPELSLYLKGDDMLSALVEYYKESHNEELEKERIKLEEERNEIERERIRAYERQEKENRRQQEKFERQREENQRQMEYERLLQEKQVAQQEAEWAAARIRCAQCKLYDTCCSMSKNKKPHTSCFRSR